jgi:tetratricopeptide (TPR) repeat protein
MKRYFCILTIGLLSCIVSHSQGLDSLLSRGDDLRSNGYPNLAIKEYLKALELDQNSPKTLYNIAYVYLALGNLNYTVTYCNRIIGLNSEKQLDAYILKGSALDYMGKQKKSIRLYQRALRLYPKNYLLHYNLGICYHNTNNLNNAEDQYLQSIELDKLQPGSYYMLGILLNEKGERVKSILSLYFFLLLEPNTERSVEAYKLLLRQWKHNVKTGPLGIPSIQVMHQSEGENQWMNALDMEMSAIYARNLNLNQNSPADCELLRRNTIALFNSISCIQHPDGIEVWSSELIQLFGDIALADQADVFGYWVSLTCDDASTNAWLEMNRRKISAFSKWINERVMNRTKK